MENIFSVAARRSAAETAAAVVEIAGAGGGARAGVIVYLAINFYTPGWYTDRPSWPPPPPQLMRGSAAAVALVGATEVLFIETATYI